eukprot:CAMPEP_0184201284 /NCGR_PEP_ID=MMETSP0976-20121227/7961_1 /TAXON_ID=483370 /ORGANISM="non described non described, Strain CCMP2097" /LENGTH=81 /DNA_ID=CAMNT_0026505805 /DNA_START=26 /DNA_END=268 /DNA_ORIENTATION=+
MVRAVRRRPKYTVPRWTRKRSRVARPGRARKRSDARQSDDGGLSLHPRPGDAPFLGSFKSDRVDANSVSSLERVEARETHR